MTEDEMRAAVAPMIDLLRAAAPGDALAVLRASGDGTCNFYIGASDVGVVAAFAQILLEQITKVIAAPPRTKGHRKRPRSRSDPSGRWPRCLALAASGLNR